MSGRKFDPNLARAAQAVETLIGRLDWSRFHTPSRLARSILLEAAELEQEVIWLPEDEADARFLNEKDRSKIESEIADVTISLLALMSQMDLDLNAAVERKASELESRYRVGTDGGRARHEPEE